MDTTLAWHFVADKLRDGRPLPPDGEWLVHDGECQMCVSGLHASLRLLNALLYAPGSTVCRVMVRSIADKEADKLVARERLILWRLDKADELLQKFVRQAALAVIHRWEAPQCVKNYLTTGDENLRSAAREAAWAAQCQLTRATGAAWAAYCAGDNHWHPRNTRAAIVAAELAGEAVFAGLNAELEAMVRQAAGRPDEHHHP
jgi:hypothetical protein